jgi:adenylyltransferase/sulfurtransferase
VLIPSKELPQRLSELDPDREVVVHCRAGGRSKRAVALLREKGFRNARNLTGGVIAWVTEIDPKQPKY